MFNHLLSLLCFSRILAIIRTLGCKIIEFSTLCINSANLDISWKYR